MIIAVFTDSHLGYKRFKKDSPLPMAAFQECIERCNEADVTLYAGDMFDSSRLSASEIRQAELTIRKLPFESALFGTSGYLITVVGNHEKPQTLELLDCALAAQIKDNRLIIPNFYCIKGEILVVYAVNYMESRTAFYNLKLVKADPFFVKNPEFAGYPRVAVLILHENNTPLTGILDLEFVHEFNRTSETKIKYVINGHEHDQHIELFSERAAFGALRNIDMIHTSVEYQSELALIEPGTFMRTSIRQQMASCLQYEAEHFVLLNTAYHSIHLSSISSKEVVFKVSFEYDCTAGMRVFEEFVRLSIDEVLKELFEIDFLRFKKLDEKALNFAASRCGLEIEEYCERVTTYLSERNVAVYQEFLLFRPAIYVEFVLKSANLEHRQFAESISFEDMLNNLEGVFENDNFLDIVFESDRKLPDEDEILPNLEIEGLTVDYSGIPLIEDYVREKIEQIFSGSDYVGDTEAKADELEKCYADVLQRRVLAAIDSGLDLHDNIGDILHDIGFVD